MKRVAVVTGAGRGIGAAVSDLLRDRGWCVVGIDRQWPNGEPEGSVTLDLSDSTDLGKRFEGLDQLDGLVNNAAVMHHQPFQEIDQPTWSHVLDVNLTAAAMMLRAAAPLLIASGGSVVNVSSVHALATSAGNTAYAVAKAGLAAFTRSAALELGPEGVRVNAVLPGAVDTELLFAGTDLSTRKEKLATLAERTPLRRVALPSEVAEAVAFLLDGGRASFITGHSLVVDGGALTHLATE